MPKIDLLLFLALVVLPQFVLLLDVPVVASINSSTRLGTCKLLFWLRWNLELTLRLGLASKVLPVAMVLCWFIMGNLELSLMIFGVLFLFNYWAC